MTNPGLANRIAAHARNGGAERSFRFNFAVDSPERVTFFFGMRYRNL